MKLTIQDPKDRTRLIKRVFYLAWKACGGPLGMGVFQDRGEQDEEAVWKQTYGNLDYAMSDNTEDFIRADYVFGRMMKMHVSIKGDELDFYPDTPKWDYQAWDKSYPSMKLLVNAAKKELGL